MIRMQTISSKLSLVSFLMLLVSDAKSASVSEPNSEKPQCVHTAADGFKIKVDCSSLNISDYQFGNLSGIIDSKTKIINIHKELDSNVSHISSTNLTSINTSKHICNGSEVNDNVKHACSMLSSHETVNNSAKLPTNLTAYSSKIANSWIKSHDNPEIASMNDRIHKYEGGMDVDEKFSTTTDKYRNPITNSSATNGITKNNTGGHKTTTSGHHDSRTAHLQQSDQRSKVFVSTKAAGVAAGIGVLLASVAYVSLIVWRKYSLDRYGNREMLINEDDVGDINDEDMRHFETACIQIET